MSKLTTLTGTFDAPIHMSEEVENAAIAIPYAIILANVLTLVLGWGESTLDSTTCVLT